MYSEKATKSWEISSLLLNVTKKEGEDFARFCGLLRIHELYWDLKLNEKADFAAWGNVNYLSTVHTVYRQVSILFIFKHDFRWRIDFGPNRPWKGFAWASTHLPLPRCNLSFLPPSIREVGKEKMSILELNSIGLECLTQGWHQFRGCQLWFCFDQFDYYFRTIWLLFVSNSI